MTNLVKRVKLEALFLSLTLQVYNKDDINEINSIYQRYNRNQYVFELSKTELYFKQFVITYCIKNRQEITTRLRDEPGSDTIITEFENNCNEIEQHNNNNQNNLIVQEDHQLNDQPNYLTFDVAEPRSNNEHELRESLIRNRNNEINEMPFYCRCKILLIIGCVIMVSLIIFLVVYFLQ